jgi:DNA-binding transcriptional LysR family regulator
VVHTVSQILTMLWLVANGQGIASVPASASSLAIARVTLHPIEGLPAQLVELHLLWGHETRNPALHRVLDCRRHASL